MQRLRPPAMPTDAVAAISFGTSVPSNHADNQDYRADLIRITVIPRKDAPCPEVASTSSRLRISDFKFKLKH